LGGDLGRRRDLTVFWVLESMGDVLWTREVRVLTGATFAAQDRSLDALVKKYRVRRVCLDQSGLGERVVEEAKTRLGAGLVEGVLFTGPVKQDLASALKRRVEDKTVRVPADPDVREDLHRMRRTVTSAGNVRFDADRSSDGHADRFWALALAVHAADRPRSAPEILSGGLRTPGGLEAF
jgi:phage FluMu gp28-like protein